MVPITSTGQFMLFTSPDLMSKLVSETFVFIQLTPRLSYSKLFSSKMLTDPLLLLNFVLCIMCFRI